MHQLLWIIFLVVSASFALPEKTSPNGKDKVIPGKFIAVVDTSKDQFSGLLSSLRADDTKVKINRHYDIGKFKGVVVEADSEAAVKKLHGVVHVEPDRRVQLVSDNRYSSKKHSGLEDEKLTASNDNGIFDNKMVSGKRYIIQNNAPYGLARLSHKRPGASTYYFREPAGEGMTVYILDTGIYPEHNQYKGRVTLGPNTLDPNGPTADDHGHGTCLAGQVGGIDYGVAKKSHLVSVKVCDKDGMGSISSFIAGVNWAVDDIRKKDIAKKSVINMSIGTTPNSAALNAATKAAVDAGIFVAASSGNDNANARTSSPGSE